MMLRYCKTDTHEEVDRYEVRHWIGKNLHIVCGDEIPDDLLVQSPYRQLVIVSEPVPAAWQYVEASHAAHGATVTRSFSLVDAPVADFATAKKQQLAAYRWQQQNAGIEINGIHIDTGNDTALYITGALQKLQANPSMTLNWKTKEGTFAVLDGAALTAIGDEIFAHVQDCFDTEQARVNAIDAIVDNEELTDPQKLEAIWSITWDD